MFIDTHTHLTDNRYDDAKTVIDSFKNDGIRFVINVGYDLQSSRATAALAERYDAVFGAAGIHPHSANEFSDADLQALTGICKGRHMIAWGEIGLDYHYDNTIKANQKSVFIKQLEAAYSLKLPVLLHMRDATADMTEILVQNKHLLANGGVMHSYAGSKEMVKTYLDLGLYISFNGVVTFKNADKDSIIQAVPLDRILTETDCPYLTPHPHRGQLNYPSYVKYVYQKISQVKGVQTEVLAKQVIENCRELFKQEF